MIVICSGPDTYRARERARELVSAFREKHDPEGLSIDAIDGNVGLPVLLSRIGSASLFTKKKMVRADGCLTKMKIADVRTLASRLKDDADATILLTVETEPPDKKILDALKDAPCHHYPFAQATGSAFKTIVRSIAASMRVSDDSADLVAEATDGDTWQAVSELMKQAANPSENMGREMASEYSAYDIADEFIRPNGKWRAMEMDSGPDGILNAFLSQSRAVIRVRDGMAEGLHPFVVRKLQRMTFAPSAKTLSQTIAALVTNRSSLSIGTEWDSLVA